ncbi:MAG: hypothetical protein GX801_11670 [Fibrobacter sp.]|nr:hypothetical protein [Fibrobacter sp.]
MKKILLLSLLLPWTLSFASAKHGFFADTWESRPLPDLSITTSKATSTGTPALTFSINTQDSIQRVLPGIFANNTNPWLGTRLLTDEDYGLEHLRQAKIPFLRLPGGNWTNKFLWDGTIHWDLTHNFADSIQGRPRQTWTFTADEMIDLALKIGAEPQICVNFSLARFIPGPDSVEQAAHYAANWVRHVKEKGLKVRFWEVGNENYGSWQAGWSVNGDTITGEDYGRGFAIFVDSMKAADPTIKIGAVVLEQDNGRQSGGHRYWMRQMLPHIQDKADFLAYHEYFTWEPDINDVTVDDMLNSIDMIGKAKDSIHAMVGRYTNKAPDHFPLTVTEYNVRAGLKDNQAISAIYNAMALGEFMRHGYGLINLWNIANGYHEVTGDQGMLTESRPDVRNYTPHPNFYNYYLYQKMWGDFMLKSTPVNHDRVRCYASAFADGSVSLVIINAQNKAETAKVKLENYTHTNIAYGYTFSAPSPTSEKVFLNDQGGEDFGPLNYAEIPPWEMNIASEPVFDLPPWSIQHIIVRSSGASVPLKLPKQKYKPENELRFDLLGRNYN